MVGTHQGRRRRRSTRARGSDRGVDRLRQVPVRPRDAHPGSRRPRSARPRRRTRMFKENWQREKMTAAGIDLPDFGPVQNKRLVQRRRGHDPRHPCGTLGQVRLGRDGRIFGAWVDLREGETFGAVFTTELDPSTAIFVPRGVGNSYQTLEADTAYTYLVNDHWSPDATYTFLNLADETSGIEWPIPLSDVEISAKDKAHPRLTDVVPMPPKKILVTGANGQLGRALRAEFGEHPWIEYAARDDLDLTSPDLDAARRWRDYGTIINAAAYNEGRRGRDSRGARRGMGLERHRRREPGPRRRGERCHPRPRVERLRLRRGARAGDYRRTPPSRRSASTARPKRPATRSCPPCRSTTSYARAG